MEINDIKEGAETGKEWCERGLGGRDRENVWGGGCK